MNTHYWKEHVTKHFIELKRNYYQDLDKIKAVPCPDPRCGLSFDSVDTLQYHFQNSHSLNVVKFIPYGSAASRAVVKDDYRSESPFEGLDDKPQVDFVNETVDKISSVCIENFVPKDESGLKRKRGRPKKLCCIASVPPTPTVAKDQPGGRSRRGRPKKCCSESTGVLFSAVLLDKLGIKRKRGRARRRNNVSSTASSSRSASPQSCTMQILNSENEWGALDNDSQSRSDYELVELSTSIVPQELNNASKKRKRKGSSCSTSSTASSSPSMARSSRSARSSQRPSSYSIIPRTSTTSTPCYESYQNHK
jgi:hypothetical protein